MRLQEVDLIGDFYSDSTRPWSQQDTVNWIPVLAERSGTRTPKKLRSAPGLRPFAVVGAGPIRGMRNVEGRLFVVSGGELYQVLTDGSAILRGTIPGVGLVSLSHNQITGGNEVLIVNGTSGYVWNTVTETLVQVTDDGYPGAFVVDYVDQFLVQVEPFRRFWFHSQLADALDYNTLDRYESEASPDLIRTLVVYQRQVFVFNERTIEPFVNVGTATGTFQRASGVVIEKGCKARYSAIRVGNTVCWLGDDDVIYALNGYNPQPISTKPIADHIRRLTETQKEGAFAFAYEDAGHEIYYLTFPNDLTWGYDLTTGLWHRRESFELTRWRLNALEKFNGFWLGGDFQNGTLYTVDWDWMQEGQDPLVSSRTAGVLHAGQNKLIINAVEILIDTQGKLSAALDPPNLDFRITGDVPNGAVGITIAPYQYMTQGGVPPYGDYELDSGAFPPGVSMSATGLVTGTPTVDGSYVWRIRRQDADGNVAFLNDSAEIEVLWTPDLVLSAWGWYDPNYVFNIWEAGTPRKLESAVDKLGNGPTRDATNMVSSDRRPIEIPGGLNGLTTIRFGSDGTGDSLNIADDFQSNRPGLTAYMVSRKTPADVSAAVEFAFITTPGGGQAYIRMSRSQTIANDCVAGGRRLALNPLVTVGDGVDHGANWVIHGCVLDYQNTNLFNYVDGSVAGQDLNFQTPGNAESAGTDTNFGWNESATAGAFFVGDMAEMVLFNDALSDADRQKVEGYLAWRWGLEGNLPSGHPYKNFPPLAP